MGELFHLYVTKTRTIAHLSGMRSRYFAFERCWLLLKKAVVFSTIWMLAVFPVVAQTTTAEITGRVSDASGAFVGNAAITVLNTENGIRLETVSNNQGLYAAPALQPGHYRVIVQKQGFRPVSRAGIILVVDQVARLDFQLELGEVTGSVQVSADAPDRSKYFMQRGSRSSVIRPSALCAERLETWPGVFLATETRERSFSADDFALCENARCTRLVLAAVILRRTTPAFAEILVSRNAPSIRRKHSDLGYVPGVSGTSRSPTPRWNGTKSRISYLGHG